MIVTAFFSFSPSLSRKSFSLPSPLFFFSVIYRSLPFLVPLSSCYRRGHWFSGKSKTLQLTFTKVFFLFFHFGILGFMFLDFLGGGGLVTLFAGKVRMCLELD